MKKIILMASAILLLSNGLYAKAKVEKNVPKKVEQAFSGKYPSAADAYIRKWEGSNDTSIAVFTMDKRKCYGYFLDDGTWIKTLTRIPWTKDLPKAVSNAWSGSRYKSWYVDEIKKVDRPDKSYYTLIVDQECGPEGSIPGDCEYIYKLSYSADGTLLKKQQLYH